MNPTELTDEQCLKIWTCCFDSDLREGVPLELVPDYLRTSLGSGASHSVNIDGLAKFALKLREQGEADLADRLADWARERREFN